MRKITICILLSFLIFIFLFNPAFGESKPVYITKGGYYAAFSRDLLIKIIEYDQARNAYAITRHMLFGTATILEPGLEVTLIEEDKVTGLVKILLKEQTHEWWTTPHAIELK